MKIDFREYHNTPYNIGLRQSSAPYFGGLKLKPQSLKDVFVSQNLRYEKGLDDVKNIRGGKFGTVCDGSIPLKPFWAFVSRSDHDTVKLSGRSTNIDGVPRCFLKSNANNPLSTSFVHSCSVMYLFNKKTYTHFLYHASEQVPKEEIGYMVRNFMPEGCTHAFIKPGDAYWSDVHRFTVPAMFDEIRKNAPDAVINVCHDSSKYPEVVGYQGRLYEIPNKEVLLQNDVLDPEDYGQASFKISDIQGMDTIDVIDCDAFDRASIKDVRAKFKAKNWDKEIKNVLSKILDKREPNILRIEDCKTLPELAKLRNTIDSDEYWKAYYVKERLLINKYKVQT